MKKFNIFALMLAMVVSMVSFSSCSNDDEDGAPSYTTAIPYSGDLVGTWECSEEEGDYTWTTSITVYSNGTFMTYCDYGDGEWEKYTGTFIVANATITFVVKDMSWNENTSEGYNEEEDGPLSGSVSLSAEEQVEATNVCSFEINDDGELELTYYYDGDSGYGYKETYQKK